MFCTKCGAQNPDNACFCAGCGCALHPTQAQETQPAKVGASNFNGEGKQVKIKSPASAKTGMTLGILAAVLAGGTMGICIFAPMVGIVMGPLSIVLSVPAIALGAKSLKQIDRDYREIAMQNIVYRDEYNSAKYASYFGITGGIAGLVMGGAGTYFCTITMSWF